MSRIDRSTGQSLTGQPLTERNEATLAIDRELEDEVWHRFCAANCMQPFLLSVIYANTQTCCRKTRRKWPHPQSLQIVPSHYARCAWSLHARCNSVIHAIPFPWRLSGRANQLTDTSKKTGCGQVHTAGLNLYSANWNLKLKLSVADYLTYPCRTT